MLDYSYFKEHYKLIAINLIKQQKIYADPKSIQQTSFTGHVKKKKKNAAIFLITEKAKETVLDFSKGTVKVLWLYFFLIQ